MNKANVLKLAQIIEAQKDIAHFNADEGFNMASYLHPCGTPSCIAGFAAYEALIEMGDDEEEAILRAKGLVPEAANWLGCDHIEITELFHPPHIEAWEYITPQEVAKVLRHFAETGQIDWTLSNYLGRSK